MSEIIIRQETEEELLRFLSLNGFDVEELELGVTRVTREDELPVFLKIAENNLFFEVDLGNISEIANEKLLFDLLDLNTEILPVSFGINRTNPDDPHLVLVESRVTGDLCAEELLSVFDALELAAEKAAELLTAALK